MEVVSVVIVSESRHSDDKLGKTRPLIFCSVLHGRSLLLVYEIRRDRTSLKTQYILVHYTRMYKYIQNFDRKVFLLPKSGNESGFSILLKLAVFFEICSCQTFQQNLKYFTLFLKKFQKGVFSCST